MRPQTLIIGLLTLLLTHCSAEENESDRIESRVLPSFSTLWVSLSRTDTGYVIYDPCNGRNPSIAIRDDTLIIGNRLEISKHRIVHLRKINDTSYVLTAKDQFFRNQTTTLEPFSVNIKIVEGNGQMALWTWSIDYGQNSGRVNYKWLMIPSLHGSLFDTIKNPCPGEMKQEHEFLPIEID